MSYQLKGFHIARPTVRVLLLGLQRKAFECNYEHVFKECITITESSAYCFQLPIIFVNCWFTMITTRPWSLFSYFLIWHESMRLWHFTAAKYTPDVMLGAIDFGHITDSYGFKYWWVEIVTHCYFKWVSILIQKTFPKELSRTTLRLHALIVVMKEYEMISYRNCISNTAPKWTNL